METGTDLWLAAEKFLKKIRDKIKDSSEAKLHRVHGDQGWIQGVA